MNEDISFGTEIILDSSLISSFAPKRPQDGHKGTFGRALVCSGSRYMTGALVLCTLAASRSGVGTVQVFAPEDALDPTRINCPCALTSAYPDTPEETVKRAKALLSNATSVAIGPGLDTSDPRNVALLSFFLENAPSLVIDAGALTIISENRNYFFKLLSERVASGLAPAILTPHVGEFKRLLKIEKEALVPGELDARCVQFARENKCITVLKNHKSIICTPHSGWYSNYIGNDGMAKGGSGDILTGMIVGFCAQGISEEIAAASAVYMHALTGDVTAEVMGKRAMLPIDYLDFMPKVFEGLGW